MTKEERLFWIEEKTKELQLGAAEIQVELAKLRVEAELSKKGNPWEPWKPENNGIYWYLSRTGTSFPETWDGSAVHVHRLGQNNCFRTEAAAERHALRLRSMRPTCPVPKVGEYYLVVSLEHPAGPKVIEWLWNNDSADRAVYNQGRVFTTEESAEAWIEEFGDAWTTMEDEE